MYELKYKDMKKEFARKYSLIVDKHDNNIDVYGMNANESITWLFSDLTENKQKSVFAIGKTLSGVFPELIQYNFSQNAIKGNTPMFYFYKNEVDTEYFASKLYSCIRDIYLKIKLPESEKEVIAEKLANVLNLNDLFRIDTNCPEDIFKKAIKYHIVSLISSKQFEVGIDEIKRVYPSEELVMKHYEDRLNSHDSRMLDFMIANDGSNVLCVSTPINFKKIYFSYVINFDVQSYKDNKFEIFYSCSVRRWINESNLKIEFEGQKSICFSIEGTNKMLVLNFANEYPFEDLEVKEQKTHKNENENKNKCAYSISNSAQKIITELCNKDFYDVVAQPSDFIKEGKGFVGIPISQDIVGSLTKGKYLKNQGEGTIDSLFFFEKICEVLGEANFRYTKSDNLEILDIKDFSVVSKGSFDVNSAYIAGDIKCITIFYYYKDERLREKFISTLKEIKPNKDSDNSFLLNCADENIYIFDSKIGEKKIKLKIICIETEIFQELLPKVDLTTIDSSIKDKEKKKKIIAETRKRHSLNVVSNYRDILLDCIEEYVEDDTEIVASIVDTPNYHEMGYTYRDPYKYVKDAFMKEGQHVQIRNATEFKEDMDKEVVASFVSSLKDIYTKLGVYVSFKDNERAFNVLKSIGIDSIVGINSIKVNGANIVATVKLNKEGLSVKVPKLKIEFDRVILNGSTSWEPIADGIKNINKIIKDIKLFKGKKAILNKCLSEVNDEFIKRIAVDSGSLYLFRNVMLKNISENLNDVKYVSIRDEVAVKHSTFKLKDGENYNITASCMVAKDRILGNSYISTSTRPDTLQKVPPVSSAFIQQNKDVRRARALLFDVYNVECSDLIASLIHEIRKFSFSYNTSTKLPHPLYLLDLLGDEAEKCD